MEVVGKRKRVKRKEFKRVFRRHRLTDINFSAVYRGAFNEKFNRAQEYFLILHKRNNAFLVYKKDEHTKFIFYRNVINFLNDWEKIETE